MPIYEYACTTCGERTEAKQGFDDPPLERCANCGGKLRKLYSPVGIVFKGSGFYSTDTKKTPTKLEPDKKPGGDDKTEKKKEPSSTSTSSEASSSGTSSGSATTAAPSKSEKSA